MKIYYCKFILAIIMMVCPVIASADDESFEVDGFYYNKLSSNTVGLIHAPSYGYDQDVSVAIPSEVTYEGVTYTVTSIGKNAFQGSIGIVSVTLPNSVTSIGESAFWSCSKLKEITLGDNISSIGKGAFGYCTRLKSITLPKSLKIIEESTFTGCESLSSIVIPDNIISIKEYAFNRCRGLSSLTLSKNLESIEQYAFYACDKLEPLEIPNGVKKIGNQSFSCLYNLKTLTIPSSLSTMEGYPFVHDNALTSIKVDDGNEYYDSRSNCNALIRKDGDVLIQGCVNTVIPNGVNDIGEYAFYACPIKSLNIPEGVKKISYSAFSFCADLVSVNIPSSVTSIIGNSFAGCSNLSSITVDAGNKYYDSRDNCNAIIKKDDDTLLVGSITTKIPDGIKVIGDYAFYCHFHSSPRIIPNTVEAIGCSAFASNYDIISLEIPGSVKAIGDNAFNYCYNLKKLTLNDGLNYVGNSAFARCEELTSVKIPNSVTTIGGSAFEGCESLEYITLPENLKTINTKLFYGSCLRSVDIPKGVSSIGSASFMGCPITSLTIPDGVVEICDSAFMNCGQLSSLSLPDGLKVIGERAFYNCDLIRSFTIPTSVEKISSGAFWFGWLDFLVNLAETPQSIEGTTFWPYSQKKPLHVYEGLKDAYEASEWWKEYFVIYDDVPRNGGVIPLLVDGSTVESSNLSKLTTFQLIAIGDVVVNQNMNAKIYADNELIGEADFNDVTLANNIMTINFHSLVNQEYGSDDMVKAKIVIEKGSVNVNDKTNTEALTYNYNASRSIYDSFPTGVNTVYKDANSVPSTTKRIVNGRLVIERNGKLYSLDGKAF